MADGSQINFFKGHPSARLLPRQSIIKSTTDLLEPEHREYDLSPEDRHPLTYGCEQGSLWVRAAIARLINECYCPEKATRAEHINLTGGASYGIMNILMQTTLPHAGYTRRAFLVSPTYFLINQIFLDAGFGGRMTAVRESLDGQLDLEYLAEKLAEFDGEPASAELLEQPQRSPPKRTYRYVMYLIPTYSNPSGSTYSLETRMCLVELARRYDMLLISDDIYDLLAYDQPLEEMPHALPSIVHLDRATLNDPQESWGHTVANATFSKIIAPGLRCGYQESVNSRLVEQLANGGANVSGGSPAQLNSMIIATLISTGELVHILQTLRRAYKERAETLYRAVREHLPAATEYRAQNGGYFSWCTLPEGYSSEVICRTLQHDYGVVLASGSHFEVSNDELGWGRRSVRLSVSFLEPNEIAEGIRRFGVVCRQHATALGLPF
ncbi:AaceriAGR141Cp [[Ashbya] aceris (nom. inval.)]|nr:AaceriAGR141Cp [[Ashbya] aceris (nom. inval.)]